MVWHPCVLLFLVIEENKRRKLSVHVRDIGVHLGAGKHIIFLKDPVMYVKVSNNRAARAYLVPPCRRFMLTEFHS